MKPNGSKGPGGKSSPAQCECTDERKRFQCTVDEYVQAYICVPPGREKRTFLDLFRDGSLKLYTLCKNSTINFEIMCLGNQPGYNKTCCYEEDDAPSSGHCTFDEKGDTYTINTSVCESGGHPSTTVTNTETSDSTTEPIITKAHATSPTQTDLNVTSQTRGSQTSTRLVTDNTVKTTHLVTDNTVKTTHLVTDNTVKTTHLVTDNTVKTTRLVTYNTVKTTEKMDTPAFRNEYRIPVAVAVPLTLIVLLVALIIFVRWKRGGKRFCTKSQRKLNRSQTSTLNPNSSSASAIIVNPTYDLDGRLPDDVIHLASLASIHEEAESYADILPREYESYRPNQQPATYAALQKVTSPGSDDNGDDDLPVYTPIPVNNKPVENAEACSIYAEPDTVPHHPGEGAGGASALNSPDGERRGGHQDVRSPNPKSIGYVDMDTTPIVFAETPAVSKTSSKEPQGQVSLGDPKEIYYFKLRGLSADTSGELDQELFDPSAADNGQYQSLEASSATLPLDTKLEDEDNGYDMISRNAVNLAKTAANATSSNYDHMVFQAAANRNRANNPYDTVERPCLEAALKCGDVQQQGATGGNINKSTGLKGKTATYDVVERPGMKHPINSTGEGDYSVAMPIV